MDFFQRCSICSMVSDSGIVLKISHANVSLKCPAHWWSTLRVFFLKWAQLSLASSSLWTFDDLGVAKIRSLDLKPHWDCWSVGSCMLDFASQALNRSHLLSLFRESDFCCLCSLLESAWLLSRTKSTYIEQSFHRSSCIASFCHSPP